MTEMSLRLKTTIQINRDNAIRCVIKIKKDFGKLKLTKWGQYFFSEIEV